jgi:hypothetical protein
MTRAANILTLIGFSFAHKGGWVDNTYPSSSRSGYVSEDKKYFYTGIGDTSVCEVNRCQCFYLITSILPVRWTGLDHFIVRFSDFIYLPGPSFGVSCGRANLGWVTWVNTPPCFSAFTLLPFLYLVFTDVHPPAQISYLPAGIPNI